MATATPTATARLLQPVELPPLIALEVHPADDAREALAGLRGSGGKEKDSMFPQLLQLLQGGSQQVERQAAGLEAPQRSEEERCREDPSHTELVYITAAVAVRVPYLVSALSAEWRPPTPDSAADSCAVEMEKSPPRVQVFLPLGCSCAVVRSLVARLTADLEEGPRLHVAWQRTDLVTALQLVQVASMLQIEELMCQLITLVREAVATSEDFLALESACDHLELPAALREAAAAARRGILETAGLPDKDQVRGMIASALLTADGKVWRVVQKVIDRREEACPRLAKENAAVLLAFATGVHGSIRATPHTGFFWGSRDFLYLVCRYIRSRPEHFDAMVTAMFDSVYKMDPELPTEVIDAVFKELLVHEGLSFAQCEHIITKLMQGGEQMDYLFHEWSGVFPQLPTNARHALAKGLLPTIGRCPHAALDFVLKELDCVQQPTKGSRLVCRQSPIGALSALLQLPESSLWSCAIWLALFAVLLSGIILLVQR